MFFELREICCEVIPSLKLTANAPENRPNPKRKGSYSNHPFFRGKLFVSGTVFQMRNFKVWIYKDERKRASYFGFSSRDLASPFRKEQGYALLFPYCIHENGILTSTWYDLIVNVRKIPVSWMLWVLLMVQKSGEPVEILTKMQDSYRQSMWSGACRIFSFNSTFFPQKQWRKKS